MCEVSNGKFSVVHEMREMDQGKMRESKEGDPEVGERLCVWIKDARSKIID